MNNSINQGILRATAALLTVLALPANATYSWTFTTETNPDQGTCTAAAVGNNCTQSSTEAGKSIGVTATAWASSTSSTGSSLEKATLNMWDGLAVNAQGETTTAPEHATDNNTKIESILFAFSDKITLQSITMGWHTDADFSLLRYTGSGAPNLSTSTYNTLTTNGWELVGNYTYSENLSSGTDITAQVSSSSADNYTGPLDANNVGKTLNTNNLSSSYWLITALNGAFWNDANYIGNDYFKVKNLTGSYSNTPPPNGRTPEPSTIALLAIALASWFGNQRKNQTLSA